MTDEPDDRSEEDRDTSLLERHATQLMEHFDSIQIFATRQQRGEDGNETVACNSGQGNWYARLGQIREWMIREDERIREHHRRTGREDDDE